MACVKNILVVMYVCLTFMANIHGNSNICNCGDGFSGNQCQKNSCEGITCQNDGTCQEGIENYVCICKDGYGGTHCENYNGDYALYRSFDTLNGLMLMEGTEQINFCGLVAGQVNYAVSTDQPQRQWIDLGSHPEACMTEPDSCGMEGGAISLWFRVISCTPGYPDSPLPSETGTSGRGIISTITSSDSTGFHIYCVDAGISWFGINRENFRFYQHFATPYEWTHIAVNLHTPEFRNETETVDVYLNGESQQSEIVSGNYDPVNGRIVIGRLHSGLDANYGSGQVDELLLYNKVLSDDEIGLLSQ